MILVMIFLFCTLLVRSPFSVQELDLLFWIHDDPLDAEAIARWTLGFNDELHLRDLINHFLVSLLKSGHRTKKVP